MKKQILKIFNEICLTKNSSPPVNVKVEDSFYSNSFRCNPFRGRSFYRGRGCGGRAEAPGRRYANQSVQQNKGEQPQNRIVKLKNPLDANGSLQSVRSTDLNTTGPKISLIGMLQLKRKKFALHCFLSLYKNVM